MNVLIVDDESLARDWLSRLLARMSDVCVCGEAGSGDEALEKAEPSHRTWCWLDIHIPGRDGLDVAKALGDGGTSGAPSIIFTTAHGRYAVAAFELDACDYLVKPIRYEQLAKSSSVRGAVASCRNWHAPMPTKGPWS